MFTTFNLLTISNSELAARTILMNSESHYYTLLIKELANRNMDFVTYCKENKKKINFEIDKINLEIFN